MGLGPGWHAEGKWARRQQSALPLHLKESSLASPPRQLDPATVSHTCNPTTHSHSTPHALPKWSVKGISQHTQEQEKQGTRTSDLTDRSSLCKANPISYSCFYKVSTPLAGCVSWFPFLFWLKILWSKSPNKDRVYFSSQLEVWHHGRGAVKGQSWKQLLTLTHGVNGHCCSASWLHSDSQGSRSGNAVTHKGQCFPPPLTSSRQPPTGWLRSLSPRWV